MIMGLVISSLIDAFADLADFALDGEEAQILMLGLDAAGKTTILYKCKLNETLPSIPTIGFNVETLSPCEGVKFTVWDVGGQATMRRYWRHYYQNTKGLIYVVDSTDGERLSEARTELEGILSDESMQHVPFVVVANKQDLPSALSPFQLIHELRLRQYGTTHRWHVQGVCATSGKGILEVMQAMAKLIKESNQY